jgi:hypothetical protein
MRWLQVGEPAVVRIAAARWVHAAAQAGRIDKTQAQQALFDCASTATDNALVEACQRPQLPPLGPDEVVQLGTLGRCDNTLSPQRLIAVRLADGSVWIGYCNRIGELFVRRPPQGEAVVENPAWVSASY